MYLFGQDDTFLLVECEKCGRVLKVNKTNAIEHESNYTTTNSISCQCGKVFSEIEKEKPVNVIIPKSPSSKNKPVSCPKCGSTQISANKKGFGLGKAAVGGVLTGGVGLLGGFIGSKKIEITCLSCGKRWQVGKK